MKKCEGWSKFRIIKIIRSIGYFYNDFSENSQLKIL